MQLLDVSVPLRPGMAVYEGDPAVAIERLASIADGGPCNLAALSASLHTGTHIDAPCHFVDGAGGIETVSPERLCGPVTVASISVAPGRHISRDQLARLIAPGTERVLLRTGNGDLWDRPGFSREYTALTIEAAAWLVDAGVRLIGIDYLSVAPFADPRPVHELLLRAGVVILEGLDLRQADHVEYELLCLPLLIPGADGAPARAVLRR